MSNYKRLIENNRNWIEKMISEDANFFTKLNEGQNPEYLYIGCSDSRVTAEEMVGAGPGEMFVHRNVANLVVNTDLNVMSVIEYAVVHLKVKHIIICGHYNCGGVKAAMQPQDLGLLNPWLRNIRDVYRLHVDELDAIKDEKSRYNRLVELNVREQAINVIKIAAVQREYNARKLPTVHGWVFNLADGKVLDQKIDFEKELRKIQKIYNLDHD